MSKVGGSEGCAPPTPQGTRVGSFLVPPGFRGPGFPAHGSVTVMPLSPHAFLLPLPPHLFCPLSAHLSLGIGSNWTVQGEPSLNYIGKGSLPNKATPTDSERQDLGVRLEAIVQSPTVVRSYFCVRDVAKGVEEAPTHQMTQKSGGGGGD